LTNDTDSLDRARMLAEAALDRKARDIVVLEVGELTSFADAFVIATATSDRHARAVADAVVECAKAGGTAPLGIEGYDDGEWVLIDLNDIIVHVFQGTTRGHYDLERLWADAPSTVYRDSAEETSARSTAS
jgi:ribosome-associated protein